ncbi:MAG: leucine-rich repeat domain-containing protein [Muribaculaceae bacterium]|nr:leucine-rich repeat domain-containing protein [Muribaculaceae bacterium]
MKRIISLLALGGLITYSVSALDLHVTPGTLSSALENTSLNGESRISLVGAIDARDLGTLQSLPSGVKSLNLSATEIEKYVVRDGKLFNHTLLEANTIPELCFFRSPLTEIELPASTKAIASAAFAGSSLKTITIPEGVTSIGDYAFYNCPQLEEVVFPASIAEIGKGAFANCPKLKYVTLPPCKLTAIPEECFAGDTSLTEFYLPASVKTIGKEAFRGTRISSLDLASVKELQPYALSGMLLLTDVTLAQDSKIGTGALMDNSNLYSVAGNPKVIPDYFVANCYSFDPNEALSAASEVGDYAFANSAASNLVLGKNVSSLGSGVFKNMGTLSTIDAKPLENNLPEVAEDSFDGINPADIKLFVTDDSYDAWKNHPQWGQFDVQSEQNVGTEIITDSAADSSIAINLNGNILVITSADAIDVAEIFALDGTALLSAGGSNEITFNLDEINNNVVIVRVVAGNAMRTLKVMIR